jgi:hypothetical protein
VSEYRWSCETVSDAIVEVSLLLYDLFGEYQWVQVSEVDLCVDAWMVFIDCSPDAIVY